MKKLIFGCTLMLVGMIGFVGCLIAEVTLVQPGAWSGFFHVFTSKYHVLEAIIIITFLLVSVIGTVISIKALKEDK